MWGHLNMKIYKLIDKKVLSYMEVKEQSEICENKKKEAIKALRAYKRSKLEYQKYWQQYMIQCNKHMPVRSRKLISTFF